MFASSARSAVLSHRIHPTFARPAMGRRRRAHPEAPRGAAAPEIEAAATIAARPQSLEEFMKRQQQNAPGHGVSVPRELTATYTSIVGGAGPKAAPVPLEGAARAEVAYLHFAKPMAQIAIA